MPEPDASRDAPHIDWEAFYANYRKPDYVPGYEILQKLGAGAFGLVFKARKHSIGKDYAIKFLKVDDAVVRDAVLHELDTVRLFAQIDHPNLVSIEDMGHVDGIPFIVMGYAGDETLGRTLQSGRMPRAEALRVFVQVCRGVQALHERMLVHFDLKPANVYRKGDTVRVGDYGLSKLVTASRRSLSFGRGTTYYMAPEVLQRKGDHRSDIYSLGVMLYECLVGHVPFTGESEWEILKKHESEAPTFPPDLHPNDRALLAACLAKHPDDRPQSIADVLAMVQGEAPAPPRGTAAGRKVLAPPGGRTTAPRWPVVRTAIVVLLLALLVLGMWVTTPARLQPATAAVQEWGPAHAQESMATAVQAAAAAEAEVAELYDRIDAAISALQRLRQVDISSPAVREKAMGALGATLRRLDLNGLLGHDLWTEALLRAIKAGLQDEDVRNQWGEVMRGLIAPPARGGKER